VAQLLESDLPMGLHKTSFPHLAASIMQHVADAGVSVE
jgi:hypothetical protein